ncbi:ABC transporter ATP-binding protein [Actinokineospora guangxiensis]|uniref:ABC transporter ATP-binding protein n=1 Tax=Actinokineospora guangxiensis TaxID=1490288 RepID=A0ABW0EWM7_9PSEU
MNAVEVRNLVKKYPKSPAAAVDGLSFQVRRGEVFGLLGPNGAGKTTTIGAVTTRLAPTEGEVEVDGVDVRRDPVAARARLGVVPQRNNLDRSLDIRQNLLFHAAYHGVPKAERVRRADALLERLGLGGRGGDRADRLSGGQAQRVMIARALMHEPSVLVLDEPSGGLDPQSRLFVHERVADLKDEGVTVVVTTHDMAEAAKLCDRVGIVDKGKLLAVGTPDELTASLPGSATLDLTVDVGERTSDDVVAALCDVDDVIRLEVVSPRPPSVRVRLYTAKDAAAVLPAALAACGRAGLAMTDAAVGRPSLEDVFLNLTGRELR